MERWLVVKVDKTTYPYAWDIYDEFTTEEEAQIFVDHRDGYALNLMGFFIVPVGDDQVPVGDDED